VRDRLFTKTEKNIMASFRLVRNRDKVFTSFLKDISMKGISLMICLMERASSIMLMEFFLK
jgi:hypothetical protein